MMMMSLSGRCVKRALAPPPAAFLISRTFSSSSKSDVILTFSGPDRKGLVRDLASITSKHGCLWTESRSLRLADRFSTLCKLNIQNNSIRGLENDVRSVFPGYVINLAVANPESIQETKCNRYTFTALGPDRENVVRDISAFLGNNNINVESVETMSFAAPHAGYVMFKLSGVVAVPDYLNLKVEKISDGLSALGNELGFDIDPLVPFDPEAAR